ncbi:MAG: hypothetical protein FJ217_16235 [Ignavibacteria bacterium]|nr:hypothetical protein [Ignavibacteria bacterium]
MKRLLHLAGALVLSSLCVTLAFAQRSSSASQVVTFSVHRPTPVTPAVIENALAKHMHQVSEPAASVDPSPTNRFQPKLSVALDSHRRRNLAHDLALAEDFEAAKNELTHTKTQREVVLTVTD